MSFISGVKDSVSVIGRIELISKSAITPVPSCCEHWVAKRISFSVKAMCE